LCHSFGGSFSKALKKTSNAPFHSCISGSQWHVLARVEVRKKRSLESKSRDGSASVGRVSLMTR
jgi:hypothetical protein